MLRYKSTYPSGANENMTSMLVNGETNGQMERVMFRVGEAGAADDCWVESDQHTPRLHLRLDAAHLIRVNGKATQLVGAIGLTGSADNRHTCNQ